MLWSIGSICFLGNHCKYFIQFHIVLCSTKHWRFDVNSVNVLTSMAVTLLPLQSPVLSKGLELAGPIWHAGNAHLGVVQDPIFRGEVLHGSALCSSTPEPSEPLVWSPSRMGAWWAAAGQRCSPCSLGSLHPFLQLCLIHQWEIPETHFPTHLF